MTSIAGAGRPDHGATAHPTRAPRPESWRDLASRGPFAALATLAPVGLFQTDAAGAFLFVNRTWCELAGISADAALGDGWLRAVAPEDVARVSAEWREAAEAGRRFESEYRFRRAEGAVTWLKAAAEPLLGGDGRLSGYVGSVTDISDGRQHEEQLRAGRERLLEAQAIGAMGNWEADLTLRPTFWSPQLYQVWGRSPAEGPPSFEEFLDAVLPEDRTAVAAAYERLQGSGEPFSLECRLSWPDGDIRHLHCVGTRLLEPGRPPRLAGTIQDVTEQREVEEALRERDAELRSFYETSPLMMGIVELVGDDILHVSENPATTRFFGSASADLGQRLASEMGLSPALRALWVARYQEAGAAGRPVRFEYRHPASEAGASRWLSATVCPIETRLGRRPRFAYVVEDASARKRAEETLAVQADELARSNRELEQFAYVASHDLQEPLRTVASYAQLLADRYQGRLDPDADEFLGFITDGAARMGALITDLLSYARVSTRREPPSTVDMGTALTAALAGLQAAIAESGAVVSAGPLPTVRGAPRQLEQLWQNLVGNAIKFAGGRPPRVEVRAELSGGAWVFAVSDNGIGIAPEHAERIFQIFQRLHTRAEYPGTGIGLALCRRIVEEHGGRIWLDSAPGAGATFRFTLPAQETGGQ